MKIEVVVLFLSLLQTACSKSLARDAEVDFKKLMDELTPIINRATIIGGSNLDNSHVVLGYIANVNMQYKVSKVETLQEEVLQKMQDLGNKLCYEIGKAELENIASSTLYVVKEEFRKTVDDEGVAFENGMARIRQYKGIPAEFRKKFWECSDEVCKNLVIKEVREQVSVIGKEIDEYVASVRNQIETTFSTYEMEILEPQWNGFTDKSQHVLEKAKECADSQTL